MNEVLEYDDVLQDIWIEGEIPQATISAAGHAYFTLRDGNSSLRCVMFRNARGMEHVKDGAAITAHGRMAIYEARGDLQLIVDVVQPEGVGELQLKLEQLMHKLEQEGLFDPSRKRPIPEFPRRVGVITSETGAVWHDIQTVTARRYPLVELVLAPTLVQGDQAAAGIVEAFGAMSSQPDIDVIIVGRGGGSFEDLWPFNEEAVARAVFSSQTPVISAVGHETDHTICDLVADLRAATPSAAAELAVPDRAELAMRVASGHQAMGMFIDSQIFRSAQNLDQLKTDLDRAVPDFDTLRLRLDDMLRTTESQLDNQLEMTRQRTEGPRLRLQSLNPADTLRRGYAIVERKDSGAAVTDADDVAANDVVRVQVSRGSFDATVID
jgi:exodeoxyribonuclease VII large subunit